jgi:pimeloyl-ACP methyl ester carboxylesterase
MKHAALDERYAPRGLTLEGSELGLEVASVSSALGTVVMRSRRTNRSTRATIFLHGAAGSWTTWTPLLGSADALGVAIPNPVLLDLPGWGEGTLTAEGEANALEAVCSLTRAAAESLGYTEWDLVGHSMGGFLAMHMGAIWPDTVLSVGTLSGTAWSVIDAIEHPIRRFWSLPGFVLLWWALRGLSHLGTAGSAAVRLVRAIGLLRVAASPLFRHPFLVSDSVIAALADEVRPRAFTIASRIAGGYSASSIWATIDCPVRAVVGDHDVFSRPSDLSLLAQALPESHRAIIAECGHFALIEQPIAVLRELGFTID